MTKQEHININGEGKVVGENDNSVNIKSETHYHPAPQTKLSLLFDALKTQFEQDKQTECISDELRHYQTERDTIGLEQKLIDGNLSYLFNDASYLKEIYTRKLYKYQLYESAQEIHIHILDIICYKFRLLVYPLLNKGIPQEVIQKTINNEIVDPIVKIIMEQGCNDIMGLRASDIEGMIYFLTGRCHIKWKL